MEVFKPHHRGSRMTFLREHDLIGPSGHSVMVSMVQMDIDTDVPGSCQSWVRIYTVVKNFSPPLWEICNYSPLAPAVVATNHLSVAVRQRHWQYARFRLLYTFHNVRKPHPISSALRFLPSLSLSLSLSLSPPPPSLSLSLSFFRPPPPRKKNLQSPQYSVQKWPET